MGLARLRRLGLSVPPARAFPGDSGGAAARFMPAPVHPSMVSFARPTLTLPYPTLRPFLHIVTHISAQTNWKVVCLFPAS